MDEPSTAEIEDDQRRGPTGFFHRRYGAGPVHLFGLLLCFAVAGYAVLRWLDSPSAVRLVVWFVGALVFHDFLLFPLYSVLDRTHRLASGRPRHPRVPLVNHVRVPLLFSGLLLLLWFPLIFNKPEPAYQAATGLDTSPYLGRWLAVSAGLAAASAVIYLVRLGLATGRKGAEAKAAMPSSNPTDADQPSP
jgi:hypothetical protein